MLDIGSVESIRNLAENFANKQVLVTGASGFMGSHLTDALVSAGAEVNALVRPRSFRSMGHIQHLNSKVVVHRADIQDHHATTKVISKFKDGDLAAVFHLAAQAHVGESWDRPYQTVADNVLGTMNLLQACIDSGVEPTKFISAGTSEEYGNVDEQRSEQYRYADGALLLDESSPLNPKSVYGVSKVAADFMTKSYHAAYGLNALVVRSFNNYGPRQSPRYITGTVISQALTRSQIKLGYIEAKRDMCFCADGIGGYLASAVYGVPGDTYVFGLGENVTMREWTNLILKVGAEMGAWPDDRYIASQESRDRLGDSEVQELLVDATKLRDLSGWKPAFTMEDGIRHTIAWYERNRNIWIDNIDWD